MKISGLFLLVFLASSLVSAQNQTDALHARDEALRALQGFNPATVLKGYTTNPEEAALLPKEGSNTLGASGLNALQNNDAARSVYNQAGSRDRVQSNPMSPEMRYAEELLENPDSVLEGRCYKKARECINQSVIKTCDESVHYSKSACKESSLLEVQSTQTSDHQCARVFASTCTSFINQGCQHIASSCVASKARRCQRYTQTFSCTKRLCSKETIECQEKVPCADGQCDTAQNEPSDDMAEGLSRLGALSGVSEDVASKQVRSRVPAIFTGSAQECKKYPLGFRDCCTDSGWGDWIKNCPQTLQALLRAKQENRVVYLGSYKKHRLGEHHYSYCVFPSKLAALVQIQGRGAQLGIPYGTAKYPDCRGLTPEELSRIHFNALNLSSIQQELMARMRVPDKGSINQQNQSHIERLKQKGEAHD